MKRFAVVMAGGIGSRLWPLSTRKRPKQFIKIENGVPLIEASIRRLDGIVCLDDCYVITSLEQEGLMRDTLDGIIPSSNIIYEPLRKNTCACITYAALSIKKKYGNGLVCFVPSDSLVGNSESYKSAINTAFKVAEESSKMVVIGIKPSYPATGYGYIKVDAQELPENSNAKKVVGFTEKPCIEKAKDYLASEQYLWNSGMLVAGIDTILENVEKYMPELFCELSNAMDKVENGNGREEIAKAYADIKSISFDFGILEKTKDLFVVRGDFDWSDIGNLETLSKLFKNDSISGSAVVGNHVGIDTTNSIIYGENSLIVTIGLDNIVVVNMGDVVLVCQKDRIHEIGNLVDILGKTGYEKYL